MSYDVRYFADAARNGTKVALGLLEVTVAAALSIMSRTSKIPIFGRRGTELKIHRGSPYGVSQFVEGLIPFAVYKRGRSSADQSSCKKHYMKS